MVGNVAPASAESTVAPPAPTATAFSGVEKATDSRFRVDGETSAPVWPPSVVLMSMFVPRAGAGAVAIRHRSASLQEI